MSTEVAGEEKVEFQKLSTREKILVTLLDGELHFSPLMEKVKCSRGPLNTQLRILRTEKPPLIEYGEHDEDYKFCCPSRLTCEGEKEARKIGVINSLRELPYSIIEQILFAYKNEIIDNLTKLSNEPVKPYRRPIPPALRKNGVKYRIELRGGPFSIPCYELSNEEKLAFSKMNSLVRHRAEIKKSIEAIEGVLKGYDFSEQEIIKMWLRNGSVIARILRFRSEKNQPSPEEIECMKSRIRELMVITENFENGRFSNVKSSP
jgi:hypothetical protein